MTSSIPSTNGLLEQLAVLIPFRAEAGSWEFGLAEAVGAAWSKEFPEVQVVWGDDGGEPSQPLNYSRAMNIARSMTDRTLLLNSDYDHLPPNRWDLINAIRVLARQDLPWVRPFRNRRTLDEATTHAYLNDPATMLASGNHIGGMAINLVRSQIWDDINGFDERFLGWGFESGAFRRALKTLHPTGRRLNSDGPFVLWRPDWARDVNNPIFQNDSELFDRYVQAQGNAPRLIRRMRELVTAVEHGPERGRATLQLLGGDGHAVDEPVSGVPTSSRTPDADQLSPDPASRALTETLSTAAVVELDAAGTTAPKSKTPAAVEGYQWPTEDSGSDQGTPTEPVEAVEVPEDDSPEDTRD